LGELGQQFRAFPAVEHGHGVIGDRADRIRVGSPARDLVEIARQPVPILHRVKHVDAGPRRVSDGT
jgi:hypothetical protein